MTPTTTIDAASEPGSWAETLASASCKIVVAEHRQQIGGVAVTIAFRRITPKQERR